MSDNTSLSAIRAVLEQKKQEQIAATEKRVSEQMGKTISTDESYESSLDEIAGKHTYSVTVKSGSKVKRFEHKTNEPPRNMQSIADHLKKSNVGHISLQHHASGDTYSTKHDTRPKVESDESLGGV